MDPREQQAREVARRLVQPVGILPLSANQNQWVAEITAALLAFPPAPVAGPVEVKRRFKGPDGRCYPECVQWNCHPDVVCLVPAAPSPAGALQAVAEAARALVSWDPDETHPDDESWGWAMNEMSDEISGHWLVLRDRVRAALANVDPHSRGEGASSAGDSIPTDQGEGAPRASEFTYCAYCPEKFPASDAGVALVSKHIHSCEKHPMRAVEQEVARLRGELDAAVKHVEILCGQGEGAPGDWMSEQLRDPAVRVEYIRELCRMVEAGEASESTLAKALAAQRVDAVTDAQTEKCNRKPEYWHSGDLEEAAASCACTLSTCRGALAKRLLSDIDPSRDGASEQPKPHAFMNAVIFLARHAMDLHDLHLEVLSMGDSEAKEYMRHHWPVIQGTRQQHALRKVGDRQFSGLSASRAIHWLADADPSGEETSDA